MTAQPASETSCPYCGNRGYTWEPTGIYAYGDYGPEQFVQVQCGCDLTANASSEQS